MSATAGARPGPAWPAGLSHRAAYSISGVLEALQEQFPALTISKLRYLEDQGLLAPERTASGYRRYSEADIERLAWVLTQQRDHFLPLKVIRTRLAQLDAAPQPAAAPRPPRAVGSAAPAPPAASQPPAGDQALADAVAAAAGTGPQAGGAPAAAVAAVGELAAHGLDLRHLRPLFQAALKAADLAALAAAAARGPGSAGAEQAAAVAQECAEAMIALHASLVRHHTPA